MEPVHTIDRPDRRSRLDERLANLISDHIVPRLVPELEIVCGAGAMFWLFRCTPARFDRTTYSGRVWTEASTCGWGPPIGGPTVS